MVKIPSALKWMMNRRARLLGEIKKVEKRFDVRESDILKELNRIESRAQTLRNRLLRIQNLRPQHLAVLQQNLAAINNAIGQHEVMIDTDLIRPLKGQDNAWLLATPAFLLPHTDCPISKENCRGNLELTETDWALASIPPSFSPLYNPPQVRSAVDYCTLGVCSTWLTHSKQAALRPVLLLVRIPGGLTTYAGID